MRFIDGKEREESLGLESCSRRIHSPEWIGALAYPLGIGKSL